MYYRIIDNDDKVEEFLNKENIKYVKERYLCDFYAKEVAEDILFCLQDDLPDYINEDDEQYIIEYAAKKLMTDDYMGQCENEIISEAIYEAVDNIKPYIVDVSELFK